MYLRTIRSPLDFGLDFAMAKHHRDREVREVDRDFEVATRGLGPKPYAEQLMAVTLRWVLRVTSSRS